MIVEVILRRIFFIPSAKEVPNEGFSIISLDRFKISWFKLYISWRIFLIPFQNKANAQLKKITDIREYDPNTHQQVVKGTKLKAMP